MVVFAGWEPQRLHRSTEAKFEHRAGDRATQVEGILTPKDIMALKKRDSCGDPKSGLLHNGRKAVCSALGRVGIVLNLEGVPV